MRLLLAEDEEELSRALVTMLKHNNYSVDAVYNGEDALDYLLNAEYDGAILDIMMPKLDGISVLRKVRAEGNSVPVLMLTAKAEIDDRVTGLDAGADDYLTKPFAMKELLARIRAMTRRKSETSDNVLSFGNISLDRASFELKGPKETVKLAGKEFQMLEMLMVNPRQVIPGDTFMEKIWGFDSDADNNVVWVYLSNLRKRLSGVGGNVSVKASRGVGYFLAIEDDKG
ncbi:MAG: response regulator transcription factor [Lachnospiraceae bacterium]|nr:response regulator transcription factor [Lachnospiraceae bacterium]